MHKLLSGVAAVALVTAISGPALAADVAIRKAPPPAVAPVWAPTWTGFYIGGDIGGGWSRFHGDHVSELGNLTVKPSGAVAGVHAGYNWQLGAAPWGSWVVGIEGDLTGTFGSKWSRYTGSGATSGLYGHLNGLASIRGRLGFAFDRTLIYATGGVAFAPRAADAQTSLLAAGSGYRTRDVTGGVVGGGIEWKYNPNLSFRLEGLHYIFNEKTNASTTEIRTVGLDHASVIRVGFSYHFGGDLFGKGKGPVVARY